MYRREEPVRFQAARGISALALGAAMLAVACGSPASNESAAPAVATSPAPEHAGEHPAAEGGGGATRVFFVEPKNGATLKSPVKFVFGAEGITIAAVPEGTVTTPRPQVGHHHLGVEQDCMPGGQEIVRGTPNWVHFGKGDSTFEIQLTPGPHKFALQVGDDQHKTIDGLCEAITVTVTE